MKGTGICQKRSPTIKDIKKGVPIVAQWQRIGLGSMRTWVRSLASLSGLRIQHCCGLCPAAATLIQPLIWELPYAVGAALKRPKKRKEKEIHPRDTADEQQNVLSHKLKQ